MITCRIFQEGFKEKSQRVLDYEKEHESNAPCVHIVAAKKISSH